MLLIGRIEAEASSARATTPAASMGSTAQMQTSHTAVTALPSCDREHCRANALGCKVDRHLEAYPPDIIWRCSNRVLVVALTVARQPWAGHFTEYIKTFLACISISTAGSSPIQLLPAARFSTSRVSLITQASAPAPAPSCLHKAPPAAN